MNILLLVRNFVPAHKMVEGGDWMVSDIARNAFDLGDWCSSSRGLLTRAGCRWS